MGRYDYYGHYYKESKPLETDQGIKAKSKRGDFAKNWWATRWIKALERLLDAGRLRRGRRYARKGQVLSIEETKAGIVAKVQGSRRTPYKVSLEIGALTDGQWDQVIEVLAKQALFTAQLLAGEMPQDIETVFAAADVSLFPGAKKELDTHCSCPDYANPCKHVAAVHFILGEQFDEDPFMIFRLRGRTAEQILEAIRAKQAEMVDPEEDEDFEEEAVIPLDETLDHFWEMDQPLTHLPATIKPPLTPLPILRRLGQPSFLKEDLIKLLGPAYDAISATAIEVAFEEEAVDGT